ncbi:MAG: helix-turn-helix transcriptional regulator [Chthonomonas sp.]|nr:helix-turn-helix transcriptional regulator [Chthonomonas sp.]
MRKKSIYTDRYRLLIRMLRDARAGSNVTQAEVAARIGCTESQISRWENCRLRVDIRDLDDYLEAIEIDLVDFVTEWMKFSRELASSGVNVESRSNKRARPTK